MTELCPRAFVTGQGAIRVLLVHGWYGNHRLFDGLVAALDPTRFTVARFDLRGYGASQAIPGRFDLSEAAADALCVADGLGWERFALIGHSMGGKIVQKLAIDRPERVDRVAAITPVPAGPLHFDADTRAFFARATSDDAVAEAIVARSAGPSCDAAWSRTLVAETRRTTRPDAFAGYARSFIEDDLSAGSVELAMPLLVLFGAEDRGVDHAVLEPVYRALYRDPQIGLIADSGHYPMIDDPAGLARRLTAFLSA